MNEAPSDEHPLVAQYVRFCHNPLPHRGDAVVAEEFRALLALQHNGIPFVQAVGFHSPHTLMVGTKLVSITDPDTNIVHDVGEFIIYLYRARKGRLYDTMFGFQNVTGKRAGYHHPHVNERTIPGFGDLGMLCIQQGQFHIYQHLRSGEMHHATRLLIDILHTYNKNGPYHELENWPEREVT